jgi:hypothetical protein
MSSAGLGLTPIASLLTGVDATRARGVGYRHPPEAMQLAWRKNPDRYQAHRELVYNTGDLARFPHGIRQSVERLEALYASRSTHAWHVKFEARETLDLMFHHVGTLTKAGRARRVRTQQLHTDVIFAQCLLLRTNIQGAHDTYTPFQIRPIRVEELALETGLSESTVNAVIRRFKKLGFLATQRKKIKLESGEVREITAVRWLTARFFQLLGMWSKIKRAQQKQREAQQPPSPAPVTAPAPTVSHSAARDTHNANQHVARMRTLLKGAGPP